MPTRTNGIIRSLLRQLAKRELKPRLKAERRIRPRTLFLGVFAAISRLANAQTTLSDEESWSRTSPIHFPPCRNYWFGTVTPSEYISVTEAV